MTTMTRFAAIWGIAAITLTPAMSFASTPDDGLDFTTHHYATKNGQDLYLDLIFDPAVQVEGPRPVIIYSFGGGWEDGNRGDRSEVHFWEELLSAGYAIVPIDYRLGIREAKLSGEMTEENGTEMYLRAIQWGVEDLFDATAYVVAHAEEWNINADQIVALGGSAGATNSLVAEYHVANRTPLATEHLPEGFRYGGVISMAGAFWLPQGTPLEFATRPAPIQFFHGGKDWLVTYDEVQAHFAGYGPVYYFREFAGPDYPKWFVDYPEGDHAVALLPLMNRTLEMRAFIERMVVNGEDLSIHMIEDEAKPSTFERLIQEVQASQAGQ